MQTTFKFFFSCLFCCLVLPLLSGCGGGTPKLTPAEQAEVDKYIQWHGRDAIAAYLSDVKYGADEKLVLKYVKFFVSQGASVSENVALNKAAEKGYLETALLILYRFHFI